MPPSTEEAVAPRDEATSLRRRRFFVTIELLGGGTTTKAATSSSPCYCNPYTKSYGVSHCRRDNIADPLATAESPSPVNMVGRVRGPSTRGTVATTASTWRSNSCTLHNWMAHLPSPLPSILILLRRRRVHLPTVPTGLAAVPTTTPRP
ncbi:hypothetical protein ACHAXS_010191 [Conticribra weissflogii]